MIRYPHDELYFLAYLKTALSSERSLVVCKISRLTPMMFCISTYHKYDLEVILFYFTISKKALSNMFRGK